MAEGQVPNEPVSWGIEPAMVPGHGANWLLTVREREVACWVSQAKTNREIAIILGMATRTVEKHVEALLRKLHVENRTAAALEINRRQWAIENAGQGQ